MRVVRFIPFALLFSFISFSSFAQYFNDGQDRSSIHWKNIQTMHFEVIFPEGFELRGEQVARLLEKAYGYVPYSLNHKPKKISVILHTETVKSNAFLGWSPARIEMYTTPNQGIYSQDWLEQLSIHEFRHLVQVSKLEAEMPRFWRYLLGEHAAALLTGIHLPFWFIEGDAVAAETGLSESGRGRFPDFQHEYKALLVEKGKLNFEKAYLGSFRDNVPDYYRFGYLLTAGAREKYNKLVWDSVLNCIANHPLNLTAFDKGLKKSIGLTSSALYDTIFTDLTNHFRKEDNQVVKTENEPVSRKNKYFTNYTSCCLLSDGRYFAEKSGLSDINRFVSIAPGGDEKRIFTPGYHFEESVAARDRLVVWSERLTDIRWNHADKSLLRIFDIRSNKLTDFKYNSKIFAPAISPGLDKAIVVEADNNYRFYLSEIDLRNGKITKRYQSDSTDYYITPSWCREPGKVLSILLHENKKGIIKVDLENNTGTIMLPLKNQEIKRPVEYGQFIYFIGGYRGTDDLYALDTLSKKVFRVITSRFGIADYSFNNNTIIYSDYTSDGYRMVKTDFDSIRFSEVEPDTIKNLLPFASNLTAQEKGTINFSDLEKVSYQSSPYKKLEHLFKFHSWAPISLDPYRYEVYPGVSVMSQNMLSTAETLLGYRYKWEENKGEYYLKFKYMGWFPVIDFQADYGKSRSFYYQKEGSDTITVPFSFNETNVVGQVYLPLNFSKGKYYRSLFPMVNYRYTWYGNDNSTPANFPNGAVSSLEFALRYYTMLRQSEQDIYPEWGFLIDAGYLHSLSGVLDFGQYAYYSGSFYIPGLFENHGIKIYNGYQVKNQKDFILTDKVRFPRGHQKIINNSMFSYGIDYKLPVAYPDFSLGRFIYFKKINLGFFYDQAFLQHPIDNGIETLDLKSAGIEVTFNTNLLRFFAPVDIGFRTSYLFDKKFKTDFLFNISFSI